MDEDLLELKLPQWDPKVNRLTNGRVYFISVPQRLVCTGESFGPSPFNAHHNTGLSGPELYIQRHLLHSLHHDKRIQQRYISIIPDTVQGNYRGVLRVNCNSSNLWEWAACTVEMTYVLTAMQRLIVV